ncbi:hypothetical protein SCHPADRAFT_895822 [Schizopora paradoxa]|uniref:Uncharacterized protein n=1 Tax=Schizopora paradoxa TaxID=27342 RepID=A0A0H2R2K0_9AGAM|nr:hypothetical protein SCHPADRAFT_895822 [Schizopora paradoxa]
MHTVMMRQVKRLFGTRQKMSENYYSISMYMYQIQNGPRKQSAEFATLTRPPLLLSCHTTTMRATPSVCRVAMNDTPQDVTSTSTKTQPALVERLPAADDTSNVPLNSTSFLDELRNDETTTGYTYFSTWSTNYTMSNLPGPGRLLGNVYSKAGKALEKRIGRLVNRTAAKEYAQAVDLLLQPESLASPSIGEMFASKDPGEHEKACTILLTCAKSNNLSIQVKSFASIVMNFVEHPTKVRTAFRSFLERRNELSDVIAFSWKRPGIEYSNSWLYWNRKASQCLSSHPNSFFDATADFDDVKAEYLDFSHFERLLLNCAKSVQYEDFRPN